MKAVGRYTGTRASAWLVLGAWGVASLAGGWVIGALLFPAASPTKAVAARFPVEWTDLPYSPPPAEVAEREEDARPQWLALVTEPAAQDAMFSQPDIYAAGSDDTKARPRWLALVSAQGAYEGVPVVDFAGTETDQVVAVADPADKTEEGQAHAAAEPQARVQVASAGPVPVPHAKPKVKVDPRRGHVFNDRQIASIKQRLALTPDQEQYWPVIEGALREVKWKKGAKRGPQTGHQMAQVDTSRVDMERLKSIAVPLVMSFREDQKRELRSLAHLMGLDHVASQF
jgi:hypothetical protein